MRCLLLERLDIGGRVRVIERLEVLAGLVRVARECPAGVRRVDAEPLALHLGHVPHLAERDSREGNRPLLELAGGQAGALEQQRVTVEVQPGFQMPGAHPG